MSSASWPSTAAAHIYFLGNLIAVGCRQLLSVHELHHSDSLLRSEEIPEYWQDGFVGGWGYPDFDDGIFGEGGIFGDGWGTWDNWGPFGMVL